MLNSSATQRFHRGIYLNLAAAGICLAYAAWPFFPETPLIAGILGVLLIASYLIEGRWVLSNSAANVVGLLVAIIIAGWIVYHYKRTTPAPIDNLPWPTSSLPYMALPFLLLAPLGLLRAKSQSDYWFLIFIGVSAVTLACALAGDAFFGIPLLVYAATLVIALQRLARARLIGYPERAGNLFGEEDAKGRVSRLSWVAYAFPIIATLTLGAFLLTPRMTDAQWEIGQVGARILTGISEKLTTVDLNINGTLKTSTDVAFEVLATDSEGRPKLDLSPNQRWRAAVFNSYEKGKWSRVNPTQTDRMGQLERDSDRGNRGTQSRTAVSDPTLPNLGPERYFLTFKFPTKKGQPIVLADPVWPGATFPPRFSRASIGVLLSAGQSWPALPLPPSRINMRLSPVVTISDWGKLFPWPVSREGTVIVPGMPPNQQRPKYRQVTAPQPDVGLSWPVELEPATVRQLTMLPDMPRLQRYSSKLVTQLIDSGQLPWQGHPGVEALPLEYHELVARALYDHLMTSGLYRYSQELTSKDRTIDPIEDFLLNVREGHCNRFSTALALLLRCQGIPTRLVLGFKGGEGIGDGTYLVRQFEAHSWVEVAVRRDTPSGAHWHWLTLDPTPELERIEHSDRGQIGRWIDGVQRSTADLFHTFVIDYNADRQVKTQEWLRYLNPLEIIHRIPTEHLIPGTILLAILIVGIIIAVSVSRRSPAADPNAPPFMRFLDLAYRHRLVGKRPSMTRREAVEEFHNSIAGQSDTLALTAAASRLAGHYDAKRFGGTKGADDSVDYQLLFTAIRGMPRRKA